MDNLGIPPQEPNPFVNTGTPKSGQVWQSKRIPYLYLIVLRCNKLNRTVTYRVKGEHLTPYYESKEYDLPINEFLQVAHFSH